MPTLAPSEPIRTRIRRLAADNVGPHALTKAVLAEIGHDPTQVYAALSEILPSYCRLIIGVQRRNDNPYPILPPDSPPPAPPGRKNVSRKVQAITDAVTAWWVAELAKQYHVESGFRYLGDCTADDLEWSANERRHQAAANLAEAERIDTLAAAMRRYKAATVRDLPRDTLAAIMRRDAA